MVFFDFRDMTGSVQGVVLPNSEAIETAKETKTEYVVAVTGKVNKRPEKNINAEVQNGDIELEVLKIEVLGASDTPPFPLDGDTSGIDEELRLKYRYLDLRTANACSAIFACAASLSNAAANSFSKISLLK
jgi:aspartyl-tRNA synthetase